MSTNRYWGEHIRRELFNKPRIETEDVVYDSNIIPIGSLNYTDVTMEFFKDITHFVETKCDQYISNREDEYGTNQDKLDYQYSFGNEYKIHYADGYGPVYNIWTTTYGPNGYGFNDYGPITWSYAVGNQSPYKPKEPSKPTAEPPKDNFKGSTVDPVPTPYTYNLETVADKKVKARQSSDKNIEVSTINWESLDSLKKQSAEDSYYRESITDDELEIMVESFEKALLVSEEECGRYLKANLIQNMRKFDNVDYVALFYDREGNFTTKLTFERFYEYEEQFGKTTKPVFVDTMLQVQSINDVNLNEEVMDATIAISMKWKDDRLRWEPKDFGDVRKIRVRKEDVWTPDLAITNRNHDFSHQDEKIPKLQVESTGDVTYTRLFRMHAVFNTAISNYPYDTQVPEVVIASSDYSSRNVRITSDRWNALNGLPHNYTTNPKWLGESRALSNIKHYQYLDNSEWNFYAYKYEIKAQQSLINEKKFSTLTVKFGLKRNEPYYSLTMFIPILVMTLLAPIGLILPVDAGEKMGLQITVLLTMVIYVEILQNNIPVFDTYGNTPLLLSYFIVTIIVICFCLLVSTHTLFIYHVNDYESQNFSKSEAKVSVFLAKMFNIMNCYIWKITPPDIVKSIGKYKPHTNHDIHKSFDHDDLQHGFKFFADMINRFCFLLVVLVQIVALFTTVVPAWIEYSGDPVTSLTQ